MNNLATARKWIEYVSARPEFSAGDVLLEQFEGGEIIRFCDCGCNSFEFEVSNHPSLQPLLAPSGVAGASFMMEIDTVQPKGALEFIIFTDKSGNLSGMDVHYNGNSAPVPEGIELAKVPYHAHGELAANA